MRDEAAAAAALEACLRALELLPRLLAMEPLPFAAALPYFLRAVSVGEGRH